MPRKKETSVSRFNVNTHLTENMKFSALCRELSLDESDTYCRLVRFWHFIALNRPMNGSIADIDPWLIGHFCWLEPLEIRPERFIEALQKVGYLNEDLSVHDWLEHQPLANEILKKRELRKEGSQKKDKGRYIQTYPDKSPIKISKVKKKKKENQVKEKVANTAPNTSPILKKPERKNLFVKTYTQKTEDLETHINPFLENFGKNKPRAPLSTVGQQIEEVANITQFSKQDRKCIGNHLSRLAQYAGDQVGWRLIGELKESMAGGKVRVPLAVLITKIKQCTPEVCGMQRG